MNNLTLVLTTLLAIACQAIPSGCDGPNADIFIAGGHASEKHSVAAAEARPERFAGSVRLAKRPAVDSQGTTLSTDAGSVERTSESLLPQKLADDVYVLCTSHRFGSATVGWIAFEGESILVDCPHPGFLAKVLAKIEGTTGSPLKRVILTHSRQSQLDAARELLKRGVRVYAEGQTAARLEETLANEDVSAEAIEDIDKPAEIRCDGVSIELHPLGYASGPGNLAVLVPHRCPRPASLCPSVGWQDHHINPPKRVV